MKTSPQAEAIWQSVKNLSVNVEDTRAAYELGNVAAFLEIAQAVTDEALEWAGTALIDAVKRLAEVPAEAANLAAAVEIQTRLTALKAATATAQAGARSRRKP